MNPRPTAATLNLCYPENYGPHLASPPADRNNSAVSAAESPWYLRLLPLRYIPGLKSLYLWLIDDKGQPLPRRPNDPDTTVAPRAVELGCSTGGYLSKLVDAGWTVVGVEPSETASEKARELGFCVHTGVLDDVSLPQASFDTAAAWMVIEHVFDPVTTLRQLFELLKPGGQLLFSVPNAGCWEPVVLRSAWYVWELPRHLHHFTPSKVREVLGTAGFANVKIIHQKNVLNLIGSFGILFGRLLLTRGLGKRLLRYPDAPNMWVQLAISPLAHLMAICRQGGRLTITAERPLTTSSNCSNAEDAKR
ncbi:MAG: class I SAM-dependent methyltransferase [Fuerstiella sp.]|nr:class I SAM-dependent methyltransferase [Fuerstiella sp.]MCP4854450.1 class I SAM-dependent methyltransferase [Fuerstiella sp.]